MKILQSPETPAAAEWVQRTHRVGRVFQTPPASALNGGDFSVYGSRIVASSNSNAAGLSGSSYSIVGNFAAAILSQ